MLQSDILYETFFIVLGKDLTVGSVGKGKGHLLGYWKQVVGLEVVVVFIVLLNLLEGKGRVVVVHVLLNLRPIAVPPDAIGSDQQDFVHEIPTAHGESPPQRRANDILRGILFEVREAGDAVIVMYGCDVCESCDFEFAV